MQISALFFFWSRSMRTPLRTLTIADCRLENENSDCFQSSIINRQSSVLPYAASTESRLIFNPGPMVDEITMLLTTSLGGGGLGFDDAGNQRAGVFANFTASKELCPPGSG